MEEDDLLDHRLEYVRPLVHKLTFIWGVYAIEKQKDLYAKCSFKEICSMAPKTRPF